VVEARAASVRYALTGRNGRSILSMVLPPGRAYVELEEAMRTMLAGRISHGGSLLAPFSVAYVVAGRGDLSAATRDRLDAQLDLLQVAEAGGLVLYRNTRLIPMAAVLPAARPSADIRDGDVLAAARVPRTGAFPLRRARAREWVGSTSADAAQGSVFVSAEWQDDWRLTTASGEELRPFPAFGWAVGFEAPAAPGDIRVTPGGRWRRTAEVGGMSLLWVGALWVARRRRA
jgi:hypothetical protein